MFAFITIYFRRAPSVPHFLSEVTLSLSQIFSPWESLLAITRVGTDPAASVEATFQSQVLSCRADGAMTFTNLWALNPLLILREQ